MGVLDKFLDIMKLSDDDEYDEDDFFDDDEYDDVIRRKAKRVSSVEKRLMMKATKTITSFLPSLSSVLPVLIK